MGWGALAGTIGSLILNNAMNDDDSATTNTTTTPTPATWQDVAGYDPFNTNMQQLLVFNPLAGTWANMLNDLAGVYQPSYSYQGGSPTTNLGSLGLGSGINTSGFHAVPTYGGSGGPGNGGTIMDPITGYTLYGPDGQVVDPSIATAQPIYDSTGHYITGYDIVGPNGQSLMDGGTYNGQVGGTPGSSTYMDDLDNLTYYPSAAEQEAGYSQALADTLYNTTQGIGQQYLTDTGGYTSSYTNRLEELQNPTYSIQLGGQDIAVTPKRNSMLADMASNVYGANIGQADRARSINSGLADMAYNLGMERSPVNQQMQVFEQLWPYMNALMGYRFGLPSVSSTDTATYNPSAQETLGNFTSTAAALSDLWNSFANTNNTNNTTNAGSNGSYDEYSWVQDWVR